jgi:hypothetical protein
MNLIFICLKDYINSTVRYLKASDKIAKCVLLPQDKDNEF